MTLTSAYSYARSYECQLLTPYILILFDGLFNLFTLNLHHDFINQFNTTYSLALFRAFFIYPLYSTFYERLRAQVFMMCLVKYDNNKSYWSVPRDQSQLWHWKFSPFMEVFIWSVASSWLAVVLMTSIISKKSPYKLTTQLRTSRQSSSSERAPMDVRYDMSKINFHEKLETPADCVTDYDKE